jgi:hypothetical protein
MLEKRGGSSATRSLFYSLTRRSASKPGTTPDKPSGGRWTAAPGLQKVLANPCGECAG